MESIYCRKNLWDGIMLSVTERAIVMSGLKKAAFIGVLSAFTLASLNDNKLQAKTPNFNDIELFTDKAPAEIDSVTKQTGGRDEIKIKGADTRGQGMSYEDVQDAALALSNKHLIVYVEVDKNDDAYENLIKEAVRENIRAGRDNIYVVFAEPPQGGEPLMACLSNGQLSKPLIKGRGHDEAAFIKRVYTEDLWTVNNQNTDAPRIVGVE